MTLQQQQQQVPYNFTYVTQKMNAAGAEMVRYGL